jgi:hypothetical protein
VTVTQALAFVRKYGVVLEAGRGPVTSLADAVAGGPIRGSWWGHPKGREIFALTRAVRDSKDVCVCRIIGGKITYVHRRLWPALVRVAPQLPRRQLAMIHEVHTARGRHEVQELAFPEWVPAQIQRQARKMTEMQAVAALARCGWHHKGSRAAGP